MPVLHNRRAATLVMGALTAACLTLGCVAPALGAAPAPEPNPSSSTSDEVPPPRIALRPAGSSTTGSLVGITADDGATVVAQKWLDLRTVDITINSPAVGVEVPVRVIVPAGWSQTAAQTWPLALTLHGGDDDYNSWTRSTDIEQLSSSWPVLIAMPDAGRTTAYTDYADPTAQGPLHWETFHTVELIQILERGFRASQQRVVIGISAGGYGAMDYAARHAGMFAYAVSFSGMLGVNQFPLQPAILAFDQQEGTGTARYGVPVFDQQNWDAHDPYKLIKNLSGTGVYLYSGLTGFPSDSDTVPWTPFQVGEGWIGTMNQSFADALKKNHISVTTDFSLTGEHDWASWRTELHTAWPLMMDAIGAQQTL